ncbi:type II toxin-antitoxin system Phd/YefM family antitoxin [Streptomyces sp. Li-HN-5-11]|uniref:type II toxin-antitoxin system Phd/YefM family antitoxin n=1 Tax=Streptomyces sp. Li-HN-5-11 TaxID=3075432 RepID=UPI0028A7DC64|nr:type II toxin-antitoxin system Phd/YefM family antitoxin [Streptomyces sp. Li-HN-5-11]WNM34332.1 type II toxin-antitoxin system Phd/YefM family antitoxin [Streptomyces sp. Li-HN-5-11]
MKIVRLRELNQNPSEAVAFVRSGVPILVTDRGKPVLRMVPETEAPSVLQRMLEAGDVHPPTEHGTPEVVPELAMSARPLGSHRPRPEAPAVKAAGPSPAAGRFRRGITDRYRRIPARPAPGIRHLPDPRSGALGPRSPA